MKLAVPDMSCAHCHAAVTAAIAEAAPGASARIDPAARIVVVEGPADPEAIRAALGRAGYPATPA